MLLGPHQPLGLGGGPGRVPSSSSLLRLTFEGPQAWLSGRGIGRGVAVTTDGGGGGCGVGGPASSAWRVSRQQPGSRLCASLPWKWGPQGTPVSHDPSADKTG